MEEINEELLQSNAEKAQEEEIELSHTDKIVGVFAEPVSMFSKAAKFPPRAMDWLLPILFVIIVSIAGYIVLMSNPTIKYAMTAEQMKQIEEQFQEQVDAGQISQEQADEQLERTREFMEGQGAMGMIFAVIGIVIGQLIFFFIIAAIFLLVAKLALKGDGNYSTAMVAYGLPHYIGVIQGIVMVILSMVMGKFLMGTSVATFMDFEQGSFLNFIMGKIDPFSIWFYAVFSIGLAKMFKSQTTGKYFAWVFGLWLGFGILMFFLAKAVPFLSFLAR
ncbi:MAG: hypothetical protein V1720_17025 [bacterium]